jgi:hypothetical protein
MGPVLMRRFLKKNASLNLGFGYPVTLQMATCPHETGTISSSKPPDSSKPSVSASLSLVKRTSLVDESAASRSDRILFHPALRSPLFKQTNKALFDPETRAHLPNVGIWVVSCHSSPGINIQSAWELEKLAALAVNKDTHLQFLMMSDAHHLVRNSRHQLLVLMMSAGRCFGMSLRRLWRYLTNVCGAEPQHR